MEKRSQSFDDQPRVFIVDQLDDMIDSMAGSKRAAKEKQLQEKRPDLDQQSDTTSACLSSLGTLKLLQMILSGSVIGFLWSECHFTHYLAGYCYGTASAFQLQNFPIFVSLISMVVNAVILVVWLTVWEQPVASDFDGQYRRKQVATADTFLAFIFLLMTSGSAIVESWMCIKYYRGYSCPMCVTLALWVTAAALLFGNSALYAYNIALCLHQKRLRRALRARF